MRMLKAVVIVAVAALLAVPAHAADYMPPPEYPTLPPVDDGLKGSFYLRGSAAGNAWWAQDGQYCGCVSDFDSPGYGYSLGVGFGYETGNGLRTDITVDYLHNNELTADSGETVNLRSGLAMANVYYDFPLSEYGYSAAGGLGLYVGAGLGAAYNYSQVNDTGGSEIAWGTSLEAAGAVMAGVSYDMGNAVADLGYRGIYMNKVMSQPDNAADSFIINNNFIHEVRGTVRYRFN